MYIYIYISLCVCVTCVTLGMPVRWGLLLV